MPLLRLSPAERLETTLVFEVGSTQIEEKELRGVRPGDVVLLDRLTLRPDLRLNGLATVCSESGRALLADIDLVEGCYEAILGYEIGPIQEFPGVMVVELARRTFDMRE